MKEDEVESFYNVIGIVDDAFERWQNEILKDICEGGWSSGT